MCLKCPILGTVQSCLLVGAHMCLSLPGSGIVIIAAVFAGLIFYPPPLPKICFPVDQTPLKIATTCTCG